MPGGVRAWSVFGRIGVRGLSSSARKLTAFNTAGKRTGSMVRNLAGRFVNLAKVAGAAGLAVGAIGAASVKAFATFDGAMTESLAIMGDVSKGMRERMAGAAREMAKTTSFSAKEAAESYFFLASAGLDAEQSLANLPQVASFAQAGMFDMARATELLTDAQSALGLTVDDAQQNMRNMGRVGDVLVKANTLANASVEQFAEALTNRAAPALKTANKSIEEGVALLAVFADQGIKGRRAGMQLSRILRLMSSSAAENTEEFKRLGLITEEGNLEDFGTIIEVLTDELGGLSDAALSARLEQLGFTARVQQAIKPLLGNADALREYLRQLKESKGIMDEVANKQLQSLNERFGLLADTIIDKGIAIGEVLAPAVRDLVDNLKVMIDEIDVSGFAQGLLGGLRTALRGLSGMFDLLARGTDAIVQNPVMTKFGLVGFLLLGPKGAAMFGAIGRMVDALIGSITGPTTVAGRLQEQIDKAGQKIETRMRRINDLQEQIDVHGPGRKTDEAPLGLRVRELNRLQGEVQGLVRRMDLANRSLKEWKASGNAAEEQTTGLAQGFRSVSQWLDRFIGRLDRAKTKVGEVAESAPDAGTGLIDVLGVAPDPFGPGAQARNILDTLRPSLFGELPSSGQTSLEEQGKRLMEQGRLDEAQAVLTGKMKGLLSDSMTDAGKQALGATKRVGRRLIQGIASGSFDAGEFLKNALFSVVQGALFGGGGLGGGLISKLGIFSPARITMGIGENLTKGMAVGIMAEKSRVGRAMRQVGDIAVREAAGIEPRLRAQVSGVGSPARGILPRRGLAELAAKRSGGSPVNFDFSEFPEPKDPRQAARDRQWKDFLGHSVDALREDGVL